MRIVAFAALVAVSPLLLADDRHDFEMQVRPVLAKNCWACHRQSAMGGLRLDSREAILKGGKSGPAIVEGKSPESLLMQAVTQKHDRLKMPPSGRMSDAEIAVLASWIDKGAYWPPEEKGAKKESAEYVITPEQRAFWAFQPVKRPSAADASIDRFVQDRLKQDGLKQGSKADKRTLIRRATFDLLGLPPTPAEVEAFLKDDAPDAFAKVVDRLLASSHYGERWGRYWLDVARYSDDKFNSTQEELQPNAWRYRNWVIDALNSDMPYDRFVKAQIAGDAIGEPAGLGFYALSPEMQDDRVDATSRGFLGITVACATCHDHKFDPIPTKDFYSLQSVFSNTEFEEHALASKELVDAWKKQKKALDDQQTVIDRFYDKQREMLAEILASQTERYVLAAAKLERPADDLDPETLRRWENYLARGKWDHPYLKLPVTRESAAQLQRDVVAINEEKKRIDKRNEITLGVDPDRGKIAGASLESLEHRKYILWRGFFEKSQKDAAGFFKSDDGVYFYNRATLERWLEGAYRTYLDQQKNRLAAMKRNLPEKYPFLQVVKDKKKLSEGKVWLRGDRNNPGDPSPRRFLAILSPEQRKPFSTGAGREELADAIVSPDNPLTARVIVNRVWQHHFGRGIVNTPSNFGQLGERPTHPELLDYLAGSLIDNGWSLKKLHRQIMLSETYGLSSAEEANPEAAAKDPANVLLWRANRNRLDFEALRDSMLFVSGMLDAQPAEKPLRFDDKNLKRTVYGFISRRKTDNTMALFDFPNPNNHSESRVITNVPLQRLWFMNSAFVEQQAKVLSDRFAGEPADRIRAMYRVVFHREPEKAEITAGVNFIDQGGDWPGYARILLSSNEFVFTD